MQRELEIVDKKIEELNSRINIIQNQKQNLKVLKLEIKIQKIHIINI